MNKQIEAMKLALEALEGLEALLLSMGLTHLIVYGDAEKAITNLQKELEDQPAQQTIHCKHMHENNGVCPHHNLQCGWPKCNEPEQPAQQEPITYWDLSENEMPVRPRLYDPEEHPNHVPLYTTPPAPPQQEPVATLWQHGETGRTRITMPGDITDCDARWFKAADLYTSPPPCPTCEALARTVMLDQTSHDAQRKPLTDDEIESINVRLAGSRDLARLFARAIEAAHGIKE